MNPFLDATGDLPTLRRVIESELTCAVGNPAHAWNLAVLGTQNVHGPAVRTLVLRRFSPTERSLLWHTDRRSSKVEQLTQNAACSLLFWNPELRVQLVLHCTGSILTDGPVWEQEWNRSTLTSRRAYLGEFASGLPTEQVSVNFPPELTSRPPTELESQAGKTNFVVLQTLIDRMDLLVLKQTGNIRASFQWQERLCGWRPTWLTP